MVKLENYSQCQTVKGGGGEQLLGGVPACVEAANPINAAQTKQKTTRGGWFALLENKLSGSRFGLGRGFGLGFGFGGCFLALKIGLPAFPILSFVVLLAHINTLYIPDAFRLFSAL